MIAVALSLSRTGNAAPLIAGDPEEIPPATPGQPTEPPMEDPPGNPRPEVPTPIDDPADPPAPPIELPDYQPDELPLRGPTRN